MEIQTGTTTPPEPDVIVREFQAELTEGDGRTIDARIVPYNTRATVVDLPEFGGTGIAYEESWAPEAFDKQLSAAHRVKVWLNFEHEEGLRGIVGHASELISRADALYGIFRVHNNADGDKALELVREGLLGGVSLEAKPLKSIRRGNHLERVRAHLDKVALCRDPAFASAQVLAVREAPDPPPEPEDPDPSPDPAPPAPEPEPEPSDPTDVELALKRVGFAPMPEREITRKPWDASPSRFDDEQYAESCLIDRGGDGEVKQRCALPVLEPNGDLNVNALDAATKTLTSGGLSGVTRGGLAGVTLEMKADAARKLLRYYRQAKLESNHAIRTLAAR